MSAPGYPGFPTSTDATLVAGPTTADPTSVMGPRVVAGLIDAVLFVLLLFFIGPTPLSPFAEYATNNRDLSLEEARAWVAAVHPRSWAPRELHVVERIPMLDNGKVDRVRLQELAR